METTKMSLNRLLDEKKCYMYTYIHFDNMDGTWEYHAKQTSKTGKIKNYMISFIYGV